MKSAARIRTYAVMALEYWDDLQVYKEKEVRRLRRKDRIKEAKRTMEYAHTLVVTYQRLINFIDLP